MPHLMATVGGQYPLARDLLYKKGESQQNGIFTIKYFTQLSRTLVSPRHDHGISRVKIVANYRSIATIIFIKVLQLTCNWIETEKVVGSNHLQNWQINKASCSNWIAYAETKKEYSVQWIALSNVWKTGTSIWLGLAKGTERDNRLLIS